MVLIIEGNANPESDELIELNDLTIEEHYKHYIDKGLTDKDAMKQVALDRHISKKEVYEVIKK
jgi:16S rRNA (cytidine1402-2'-O)-methyltransferase